MGREDVELAFSSEPWRPDPAAIGKLRTRVFLTGTASALVSAAPLAALTVYLFLEMVQELKDFRANLPEGQAIDPASFFTDRPELLTLSGAIGLLGVISGWIGYKLLIRTVGQQRRPPKKAVLALTLLPLGCSAFAAVSTAVAMPLVAVIIGGIAIGWSVWIVPVQLTMLAAGALTIAKNSAKEKQQFASSESLTAKALNYFEEIEPSMIELDLERLGDIAYPPTKGKCRRLWANPSRTVFVSAAYFPTSNGAIKAVSAYSVTENGKWFETANLKTPLTVPDEYKHQFNLVPDASPEIVVRLQFEALQKQLRDESDRPMQISRDEQLQMTTYGCAYLGMIKREKTGTDVIWLADQYLGLPLPPVPGRPWMPGESDDPQDDQVDRPVSAL